MRCPDCKTDVKYNRLYCPHCSAELNRHKVERKKFDWYYPVNTNELMRR